MKNTTDPKEKAPMHVMENLLYNDELIGEEVNQIIEEIMAILIKQKITITTAKHILQDTSNALERECILDKKRKKKLQKRKSGQTSLLSVALPEFS